MMNRQCKTSGLCLCSKHQCKTSGLCLCSKHQCKTSGLCLRSKYQCKTSGLCLCSKHQCSGVTYVRKQTTTSGCANRYAQERVQGSDGVSVPFVHMCVLRVCACVCVCACMHMQCVCARTHAHVCVKECSF